MKQRCARASRWPMPPPPPLAPAPPPRPRASRELLLEYHNTIGEEGGPEEAARVRSVARGLLLALGAELEEEGAAEQQQQQQVRWLNLF